MIATLKNEQGLVYAYIEYHVLDKEGDFKEGGSYCYVQDLWIHTRSRKKSLNKLIRRIDRDKRMNNVKYIYWLNYKHNERQTKSFSRERLAKLGREHNG